jgi:hypothetical protein
VKAIIATSSSEVAEEGFDHIAHLIERSGHVSQRQLGCGPVGPSSDNSHLATSTNIFNELQPPAGAPIYAKIGLFPARIVTRLSQANALKHESLPLFLAFCHYAWHTPKIRWRTVLLVDFDAK